MCELPGNQWKPLHSFLNSTDPTIQSTASENQPTSSQTNSLSNTDSKLQTELLPRSSIDSNRSVCLNHPNQTAVYTCRLCAESFCHDCVINPQVDPICKQCAATEPKTTDDIPPQKTEATALASEALKYSLVSFLCFGFILGPVAISKAMKARKMAAASPVPVSGMGSATAALWCGWISLILNIIFFGQKMANGGH